MENTLKKLNKKKRNKNFSTDEENVIQSMFEEHYAVLTSKHSNEVSNKKKTEIWSEIARCVKGARSYLHVFNHNFLIFILFFYIILAVSKKIKNKYTINI